MRIAICDDEVSMVQILEEKIKKLLPDAVIEKYLSGEKLIASGSKPDVLFLDIQMPGMDGMETAKMLRQDNEDMILIFVTAAEEYVFQAFDVGAFHYLVKPFSDEKLKEVVTKAVHAVKRSSRLEKDEKYIMVQTAGSHIKIFLRDIVYAEVYNRKVIIHTRSTDIEYYISARTVRSCSSWASSSATICWPYSSAAMSAANTAIGCSMPKFPSP